MCWAYRLVCCASFEDEGDLSEHEHTSALRDRRRTGTDDRCRRSGRCRRAGAELGPRRQLLEQAADEVSQAADDVEQEANSQQADDEAGDDQGAQAQQGALADDDQCDDQGDDSQGNDDSGG